MSTKHSNDLIGNWRLACCERPVREFVLRHRGASVILRSGPHVDAGIFAEAATGRFVRTADVPTVGMLRGARMAVMENHSAASLRVLEGRARPVQRPSPVDGRKADISGTKEIVPQLVEARCRRDAVFLLRHSGRRSQVQGRGHTVKKAIQLASGMPGANRLRESRPPRSKTGGHLSGRERRWAVRINPLIRRDLAWPLWTVAIESDRHFFLAAKCRKDDRFQRSWPVGRVA